MERKKYHWCAVPQCKNTSVTTPDKIFIDVPRKPDIRKKWFDIARRNCEGMSVTSPIYFCEDHFDLPNNMENYMEFHIMGSVSKIRLKPGTLPSKFHCQSDRRRRLPSTSTSRPAVIKRQRLALVQEALEESNSKINIEKETTAVVGLETELETVQHPKRQDKGIQVRIKSKFFRSKFTQTEIKSHNFATSPYKTWATTVVTSPFKVEENVQLESSCVANVKRILCNRSDNDNSRYTPSTSSFEPSSPSVTSLQKFTSDSSSLNEEEAKMEKEKEAKTAVSILCKKIYASPRLYIGITKECCFLIDLIHKNSCIPTEHILLCLKKIRLNTTFSELADQLEICPSYAGKIFFKNIPTIAHILKSFIVPLKKENIKRSLPIAFRHRFNKVSCIIDCFEIEIEKPSKSVNQALTWSEYKKGNTIKYLISSTPNGLINFVSLGYGGRISDTLLVENCKFLEVLEPGSRVLADRGFKHIEQVLNQKKCYLLRPPSVVQGAKLTKQEAHKTKQIASLRIHIERVIRRIREFSMLKPHSVLNSKLIRVLDDCVIIACALINLQDSIIQ